MDDDLDEITATYTWFVDEIEQLPLDAEARAALVAEAGRIYRRERAEKLGAVLAQLPPKTDTDDNKRQQSASTENNSLEL